MTSRRIPPKGKTRVSYPQVYKGVLWIAGEAFGFSSGIAVCVLWR